MEAAAMMLPWSDVDRIEIDELIVVMVARDRIELPTGDFQYRPGHVESICFNDLPGCSLLDLHNNAGLRRTYSRKIHAWKCLLLKDEKFYPAE
jgi:hypothetical protein